MYDLAKFLLWIVALIAGRQKAPWAWNLGSRIQGVEINVLCCWNLASIFSLFKPSRWYSCLAFDLTYGWREEVNFSCTCLNYWYFSADRDFNFDVSKVPWALKIRLTCCWVSAVSGCCLLNSHGCWVPGTTFGDICGQELKIAKMSCLVLLLAIFAARGWKCSRWASWVHFWPYVRPGFENAQNKLPGASFCYMCGHWLRMLKISCRFTVF